MPYYPEDEDGELRHGFKTHTSLFRIIAEYAHLPITEINDLDVIDYLILRFDSYVHALSRTKEGQEYLVNAWCRIQTEPDRAALRKLMSVGGGIRGNRPQPN